MTTTLVIVVMSAWLGALSVLAAVVVRQVALLSKLVDPDYSLDGLTVGRRLPQQVASLLPDSSGAILVLGASCAPCRELAQNLGAIDLEQAVVAIIEGDPVHAMPLAEALPVGVRAIAGEKADAAYSALDLQTTPFLFLIERRQIVDKAVLRGADHLRSLLGAAPRTVGTARPLTQALEVQNAG
ncbi:MAG TPA: hypothetical protein VEX36_06980 [Thermoleophilaceae bacterium]|nr:hypothetical protein [Thermoleophilaceae bacterium]